MHALLFNLNRHAYESRPPGVHRIAYWLRMHNWDIEVIDWANHWPHQQLQELVRSRITSDTKFIGFGQLFQIWDNDMEVFVQWVKQQYPDIVVISGAGVYPHHKSAGIDYYIQGFGENAILALLQWLFSNGTRPKFDLMKVNNALIIKANDTYPAFPMASLSIIYEDRDFVKSDEWLGIETARGCKFKCSFCNFPVLGVKGDYSRDADDFEMQIRDAYDRFGVTNYLIADETFNDRTGKITKFADVVERLDLDLFFSAFLRADLMVSRLQDREELSRMRVLGHFYGIESLNTASGRAIGKGMASEKVKRGLIECREYFNQYHPGLYRGTISLILGLPHETIETLEQSKQWLIDNWKDQNFWGFVLDIQTGDITHHSDLSLQYKKHGYTQIPESDINGRDLISDTLIGDRMYWQNQHMDIFQANTILNEWIQTKRNVGGRAHVFALARRLKGCPTLVQRLAMSEQQLQERLDYDITDYIDSKLNYHS